MKKITTVHFIFKKSAMKITALFPIFLFLFAFNAKSQITTGTVTGSPFCSCDTLSVPFTSVGVFTAGNTYTVQLSDSTGNFALPVSIGILVSAANSYTIPCTIPCGTLTGTAYRIRVISSAPADTGSDNGVNIIINTFVVPSVSIASVVAGSICIDTSVTFTASPTNGGTSPFYQWQRNGNNVGTNSAVYNSSGTFSDGEIINVTLMSNAACATPSTTQSSTVITCPAMEIPNVFTPNGDGINDIFKINLSGENLTDFNINIYDRWGILVFTSPNINYKWDGRTTSGINVVSGTYFYIIDLNAKQYKGHISVLEEKIY